MLIERRDVGGSHFANGGFTRRLVAGRRVARAWPNKVLALATPRIIISQTARFMIKLPDWERGWVARQLRQLATPANH